MADTKNPESEPKPDAKPKHARYMVHHTRAAAYVCSHDGKPVIMLGGQPTEVDGALWEQIASKHVGVKALIAAKTIVATPIAG